MCETFLDLPNISPALLTWSCEAGRQGKWPLTDGRLSLREKWFIQSHTPQLSLGLHDPVMLFPLYNPQEINNTFLNNPYLKPLKWKCFALNWINFSYLGQYAEGNISLLLFSWGGTMVKISTLESFQKQKVQCHLKQSSKTSAWHSWK